MKKPAILLGVDSLIERLSFSEIYWHELRESSIPWSLAVELQIAISSFQICGVQGQIEARSHSWNWGQVVNKLMLSSCTKCQGIWKMIKTQSVSLTISLKVSSSSLLPRHWSILSESVGVSRWSSLGLRQWGCNLWAQAAEIYLGSLEIKQASQSVARKPQDLIRKRNLWSIMDHCRWMWCML